MGHNSPSKLRRDGRIAYENGIDLTDNPYSYRVWCDKATNWEDGWLEAQKQKLKKIISDTSEYCPECGHKL